MKPSFQDSFVDSQPLPSPSALEEVRIPAGDSWINGDLAMPAEFEGVVLFIQDSPNARHSACNRKVAKALQNAGVATLVMNLFTSAEQSVESSSGHHRFDMALLTRRIQDVSTWLTAQPSMQNAALGYFATDIGSAAALLVAARLGREVSAVMSCSGRPDLVGGTVLAAVKAPTLFIIGGGEQDVVLQNEEAFRLLRCKKSMAIVPRARHLFEQPGVIEQVGDRAAGWFTAHLHSLQLAA